MTQQQLTTTTNFTITYDDSIDEAKDRADAIAATCEADLAVLTGWFGITGAFGPDDRNRSTADLEPGRRTRTGQRIEDRNHPRPRR